MNKPKTKIIYLINDVLLGGAQKLVLGLASYLDKEKFQVKVCYFKETREIKPSQKEITSDFLRAGIELINLRGKKATKISDFIKISRFLKKEKPDILHCHLLYSNILGTIAARIAGVKKIVIHEHNTYKFYSFKFIFLMKLIRSLANMTIAYSEFVEQEISGDFFILDKPPTEITRSSYTIHAGVDLKLIDKVRHSVNFIGKRTELGIDPEEILIVSVGRLIDWKGHENLIKAFHLVVKKRPRARLLIIGWGSMGDFLKNLAREFALEKSVKFLGDRVDIYDILCVSDIFSLVFSYKSGINAESIGMAGLEAMACGLPIIAADYPSVRKFIKNKENGFLVQEKHPESLMETIVYLIDNKDKRTSVGKNARKFIEEHLSFEALIKIYESLYLKLLDL